MFRVLATRIVTQRICFQLNRNNLCSTSDSDLPNVKGCSKNVVDVPKYPVGFAGASKDSEYKNPEYFCYHVDSFADAMVELEKYRLPAPSNKKKHETK